MRVIHSVRQMQRVALDLKKKGKTIALVPTMGALHRGHLDLVKRARRAADVTVVSIFVNPTQFAPHEDFTSYPRNLKADCRLLRSEQVDIVFNPTPKDMYPSGFDTYVVPDRIAQKLEGAFRPEHFRGVATVVLKLFNAVQPDVSVFGRKDLQQSMVIRQMISDLNLLVKLVVAPTVRDNDQLALSSRNAYLSEDARSRALTIPQSLFAARRMIVSGERSANKIRNYIARQLVKVADARVDYVSVADEKSLTELDRISGRTAISLACTIGGVRLIDNIIVKVR